MEDYFKLRKLITEQIVVFVFQTDLIKLINTAQNRAKYQMRTQSVYGGFFVRSNLFSLEMGFVCCRNVLHSSSTNTHKEHDVMQSAVQTNFIRLINGSQTELKGFLYTSNVSL